MTVTIPQGWKFFLRAARLSRFGSLNEAAEWMYRLNVFARSIGRHPIADQIYALKNLLIKYLYQRGYSTEVSLHIQEFDCWGTFPDGCDEDCPKCGGTGIFRTEKLYGFRFEIRGKHYAWHQPAKLIDYPIQLTEAEPAPLGEARRDPAILSLEEAWTGCCVVWWSLLGHGVVADLLIFDVINNRTKAATRKLLQKNAGNLTETDV